MIVVADTSPLTALLHLGQTGLLASLYGQVFIPATVAGEMNTLLSFCYDISFLQNTQTFIIRSAADKKWIAELSQ